MEAAGSFEIRPFWPELYAEKIRGRCWLFLVRATFAIGRNRRTAESIEAALLPPVMFGAI
jgi:hypothetical protein